MRTLLLIYFANFIHCDFRNDVYNIGVKHVRHSGSKLIRHGRSRSHFSRLHLRDPPGRDLFAQDIEAEISKELGMFKQYLNFRNF